MKRTNFRTIDTFFNPPTKRLVNCSYWLLNLLSIFFDLINIIILLLLLLFVVVVVAAVDVIIIIIILLFFLLLLFFFLFYPRYSIPEGVTDIKTGAASGNDFTLARPPPQQD